MADLTVNIIANLKKLKQDLKKVTQQGIDLNVTGGGKGKSLAKRDTSSKRDSKKTLGKLGKIAALLSVIGGVLMAVQPLLDLLQVILGLITFAILRVLKPLLPSLGSILVILRRGAELMAGWIVKAIDWIKQIPGGIWEYVKNIGLSIWEYMKLIPQLFHNLIKGDVAGIIRTIGSMAGAFGDIIRDIVPFDKIGDFLAAPFEGLEALLTGVADNIIQPIQDAITGAVDTVKNFISEKWDWLMEEFPLFKKIAEDIKAAIDKVKNAIDIKKFTVKVSFGDLLNKAIKKMGDLPQKFNPQTGRYEETVPRITDRIADGIITKDGKVIKTHPNDTIMAMQNPGKMGSTNNFYFNGMGMDEAMQRVKRELRQDLNTATRL